MFAVSNRKFKNLAGLFLITLLPLAAIQAEDEKSSPIGMSAKLSGVVLPGSELEVKPSGEKTPVVLRILEVYPHGTDFRYDFEYYGLKSGEFNLVDFLQRKDRSEMENLPEVKVTINSTLSPEQVEPNPLKAKAPPRIGGYWLMVGLGGILWLVGLMMILFWKRNKPTDENQDESLKPVSLADRLKPMIEKAIAGESSQSDLANLEMNLVTLWRKRLNMENLDAGEAIIQLRKHDDAGPLLLQLEAWLHRPQNGKPVDVSEILKPYQDLPAELFEETESEVVA